MGLNKWFFRKLSNYFTKEKPSTRSYLCDFDRICHEVHTADVLLIEGNSRVSRAIRRLTQSPWSHAALYIGRVHDVEDAQLREHIQRHFKGPPREQLVVESVLGKGTIITSIHHYKNHHIRICRPTGLSHQDAQRIIAYAVKHLGRQYNIRQIIDLWRFLAKSRFFPRQWRSTLFRASPNELTEEVCSSMIASAFASVKFPVLPLIREDEHQNLELIHRNPKLFTPSDFDYSPYLNIIKYPLFPVSGLSPYRSLPWHEGLVSYDDAGIHPLVESENIHKKSPSKTDKE